MKAAEELIIILEKKTLDNIERRKMGKQIQK